MGSTLSLLDSVSVPHLGHIHDRAAELLQRTGMRMDHPDARNLLRDNGCTLAEGNVVRFPRKLIDKALASLPESYRMGTREGSVLMAPDALHFRCQSGCINVMDHRTGECRSGTLEDVVAVTRVMERTENLTVTCSLLYPWDVPLDRRDIATVEVMLEHSGKHIYVQPYTGASARVIIDLTEKSGGSKQRPRATFITAPTTPLICAENELEIMMAAARSGIPIMAASTPLCGATSPVTLAGQIILHHAENLAVFTYIQLLEPGAPVTYGIRPGILDMRTANSTWGNVEWGMSSYVLAHLARHLGFMTDVVGFTTDSKVSDFQCGSEKTLNAALLAQAPCNMVAGVGFIETILTASPAQILLDDEVAGIFRRIRRGINWDDDRMALDLIDRVGPGGNYLTEEHTVRYFREELYEPLLFDRNMRDAWKSASGKDAEQRAREMVSSLLGKAESRA